MKYIGVLALIYCGYFMVHNSSQPIQSSQKDCYYFQYFPLEEVWHENNARYATDSSILDHTHTFKVFRFRVPAHRCERVAQQIEAGTFVYESSKLWRE